MSSATAITARCPHCRFGAAAPGVPRRETLGGRQAREVYSAIQHAGVEAKLVLEFLPLMRARQADARRALEQVLRQPRIEDASAALQHRTESGCALSSGGSLTSAALGGSRRRLPRAGLDALFQRLHQIDDSRRLPRRRRLDLLTLELLLDRRAQRLVVGVLVLLRLPVLGERVHELLREIEL